VTFGCSFVGIKVFRGAVGWWNLVNAGTDRLLRYVYLFVFESGGSIAVISV